MQHVPNLLEFGDRSHLAPHFGQVRAILVWNVLGSFPWNAFSSVCFKIKIGCIPRQIKCGLGTFLMEMDPRRGVM
jgi:hypothetical protein